MVHIQVVNLHIGFHSISLFINNISFDVTPRNHLNIEPYLIAGDQRAKVFNLFILVAVFSYGKVAGLLDNIEIFKCKESVCIRMVFTIRGITGKAFRTLDGCTLVHYAAGNAWIPWRQIDSSFKIIILILIIKDIAKTSGKIISPYNRFLIGINIRVFRKIRE